MPFDIFTLAAVRDQLGDTIVGGRIDKVIQPSRFSIALKVWANPRSHWLLLSADPRHGRVCLSSEKLAKGFDEPSPFVMLLRKHCEGARIRQVSQVPLERILSLHVSGHAADEVSLITEIMGNRSNIILVNSANEILGALKYVGERQSRVRRIRPHERYLPPPSPPRGKAVGGSGPRIDPLSEVRVPSSKFQVPGMAWSVSRNDDTHVASDGAGLTTTGTSGGDEDGESVAGALEGVTGDVSVRDALVGLVAGCSPAIAADIASRAGVPADVEVGSVDSQAVASAVLEQYRLLVSHSWQPIVILRDGEPVDFRAYASPPVPEWEPAPDISSAIERVTVGIESTDALRSARERVRKAIAGRRVEVERRLASLREGLRNAKSADAFREAGELILGYQYSLGPGESMLVVPELDREIPLNPQLGPIENAETYFKRYRKARDAGRRLPDMIATAELDLAFLDDLDAYVDLAESEKDLVRIGDELGARFGGRQAAKKRPSAPGQPLRIDVDDAQIFVGRNARQNEEVTFRVAGRSDLWLHTRGIPGAHIIVHGHRPSPDTVEIAAGLAAYFSRARGNASVDVDVTEVRNVHRRPGGGPGQVTYKHERTLRVAPLSPEGVSSRANLVVQDKG